MKHVSFESIFGFFTLLFECKNVEFERLADAAVELPRAQKQVDIKSQDILYVRRPILVPLH